jgi:hypothetical protein
LAVSDLRIVENFDFSTELGMVSLPELTNGWRYWLEILYGDSVRKTGGPRELLPNRERPQMTSLQKILIPRISGPNIGKSRSPTIFFDDHH